MIKKYYPVVLKFAFNSEYSVDGGATWTALAANTRVELDPTTFTSSGKVTVRSDDTVTRFNYLDKDMLELKERLYKSINIRNIKNVTDTRDLFAYVISKDIRIANCASVTDAQGIGYRTIANNFSVGNLPNATTMYKAFSYASINAISSIKAGKHGSNTNFKNMFEYADINYLGDIEMDGNNDISYMFKFARVDVIPNLSFVQKSTALSSNMFDHAIVSYMLYNKFFRKYPIVYMFQYTNIKFSGADLMADSGSSNYMMKSVQPGLQSPWSRLILQYGSSASHIFDTTDLSDLNPLVTQSFIDDAVTSSNVLISEIPNWLPEIIELSTHAEESIVGKKSIGAIGLKYRYVLGSEIEDVNSIQPLGRIGSKTESVNSYASDIVWFCRNGWYAVQDGADVKIYDETNTLSTTIANIEPTSAGFTSDGQKFYAVTGGIDKDSTANQTVVQELNVYNSADGSVAQTLAIVNEENQMTVGVHRPSMDSNIQLISTVFIDGGVGKMVPSTSKVEARASIDNVVKTIDLSEPVDYVCNHYIEDNEFCALNTITGRYVRCFGK